MSSARRVTLLKTQSDELVPAELLDAIGDGQIADWKSQWIPAMLEGIERLKRTGARGRIPQSSHWDWRKKAQALSGILAKRGFSIVCEGTTQGMMIVDTASGRCRVEEQRGQHLVYASYVEAAPWNQTLLFHPPRFRGVGSVLVRAAIELSRVEGFKGRVGLHSLPQADDFYGRTCGMTDVGIDPDYRMRYFEMTAAQADVFVGENKS